MKTPLRVFCLLIILTTCSIMSPWRAQAATHDLANPSEWNIRIDGEQAGDKIGWYNITHGDLNHDGTDDLILTSTSPEGYGGRTGISITYVIFSTLLTAHTGTGNTIDLADSSNYNLKIIAAMDGDFNSYYSASVADLDNNNRPDLLLGQGYADHDGISDRGAAYVLYDSLLDTFTGTGNIVDLSNNENFNIKFIGANEWDLLGSSGSAKFDFTGDGKRDLLITASFASSTYGPGSGCAYIIDNDLLLSVTGTGNIINLEDPSTYTVRIDTPGSTWAESFIVGEESDIDSNGVDDVILYTPQATNNGIRFSGSAYLISNTLLPTIGTGNIVDLADPSSYTIRIDGVKFNARSGNFGYSITQVADVDHNGKNDLLLAESYADYHDRLNSGSVFFLRDSFFTSPTTGQTLNLTQSANYSIRFDGATTSSVFGEDIHVQDIDTDGTLDIVTDAGAISSVYFIKNALFASMTGSGTIVDMAITSNSSTFYTKTDGYLNMMYAPADINDDEKTDYIFLDAYSDNNDRSDSGSVYLVYNFPHLLTATPPAERSSLANVTISGIVNASATSVTDVAGVAWNADTSNPLADGWTNCAADDGTFSSKTENFSCTISSLSASAHTIYLRAFDSDGAFTASSSYLSITINAVPRPTTLTDTGSGAVGAPYAPPPLSTTFEIISVTSTSPALPISPITASALRSSGVSVHALVKLPDDQNPLTQEDTAVYYIGPDGRRHAFPNSKIYFSWYKDFSQVQTISSYQLATISLGRNVTYKPGVKLVKFESNPKVYAVDTKSTLRWITSESLAHALYGPDWGRNVDDISDAFYNDYRMGNAISSIQDHLNPTPSSFFIP